MRTECTNCKKRKGVVISDWKHRPYCSMKCFEKRKKIKEEEVKA